jgi:hypothetical protein
MTAQLFRAGLKNGVDQVFAWPVSPPGGVFYEKVSFSTILIDETGGFDVLTSRWIAPANGRLITNWQCYEPVGVNNNQAAYPLYVAKLIYNAGGNFDTAGIGHIGASPNSSNQAGMGIYKVAAGDVFEVDLCCSPQVAGGSITINGRDEHTYWQGWFET